MSTLTTDETVVGGGGTFSLDSRRARKRRPHLHGRALPYVLVLPVLILVGGLLIIPTVITTVGSFKGSGRGFAGLSNYAALFRNSAIGEEIQNTGLYVLFGVVISTVLGTLIALRLRYPFRGRGIALAIMFLPWAIPGVVEGIIWSWLYNPSFGVIVSVLKSAGIMHGAPLLLGKHRLLTILLIELSQVWQITPLSAIIILAGLQQIPREVTEAARVDGSSRLRLLWSVTLPLASSSIAIAGVQAVIASLNIFDQAYVLNGNAPLGAPITLETYFLAFQDLNFNGAYALALLSTLATVLISLGLVLAVQRRAEYQ